MEIIGTIVQELPIQQGVSASGKEWKTKTVIVETGDNYKKNVAIDIKGDQRIKDNPCEVNGTYTFSVDIESREYNGRWFTSVVAWRIVPYVAQQPQPTAEPQPQATPAPQPTFNAPANEDQLPF